MNDSARMDHIDREQESQELDFGVTERLNHWLAMLVGRGASDLLLVAGAPPCMRVNGEVRKIEPGILDGPEIEAAVLPALPRHALLHYRESFITDASYRVEGLGRFFILGIELNTSQTVTISPKLRLECGISHMRPRTPAEHFTCIPLDFGAYLAANLGRPVSCRLRSPAKSMQEYPCRSARSC